MDPVTYEQLVTYLSTLILPLTIPKDRQRSFKLSSSHYLVRGTFLYRKNKQNPDRPLRVVLMKDVELVLRALHEDPFAGHFGVKRTYQKVAERYFWPDMRKHVYDFVKTCDACQRRGPPPARPEPLYPLSVGEPFERIGIDMVGPLPETATGNKFIIVATDYLTKWPEARPAIDTTAATAAGFLYEDILSRHGAPKELLSDRGRTFLNQTLAELCKRWQVRQAFASAYHPQTNGLVERYNKTLVETLAKLCLLRPQDWDRMVPAALFAYRTAKHETTKQTPFFLLYGKEATYPIETIVATYPQESNHQPLECPDADQLVQRALRLYDLGEARSSAWVNIERDQQKQQQRYNRKVQQQTYRVNDEVLRYDSALAKTHSGKLVAKWVGPFRIHSVLGKGVYWLEQRDGSLDERPVNAKRLKLYYRRTPWVPHVIIDTPAPFLALTENI
jgi:hypothetical protein